MFVIWRGEVPRFLRVAVWVVLLKPTVTIPNFSALVGKDTSEPTPLKATVCGLPESPSIKVSVPVRFPLAVGVKVTEMVT